MTFPTFWPWDATSAVAFCFAIQCQSCDDSVTPPTRSGCVAYCACKQTKLTRNGDNLLIRPGPDGFAFQQ